MQARVGRAGHDVVRHGHRIGHRGGQRGRAGHDRAGGDGILRDGLDPLRAVAIEEAGLLGGHDLFEDRHALIELEAGILTDVAQLAAEHAALGIFPGTEIVQAHVHGHPGEREHAADRHAGTDDDVALVRLGLAADDGQRAQRGNGGGGLNDFSTGQVGQVGHGSLLAGHG